MKKAILMAFVAVTFLCGCKKEKSTSTYEVKLVSAGTSYTLTAKVSSSSGSGKEYLNKSGISGSTTYTFTPLESEDINVAYATTSNMTLKIYVNGQMVGDYSNTAGSGIYFVHK
ncbi:hypothetical protein VRU48_16435 [Pedobacter sp. KR3-3]|uniref:PLAT domain-containing protein n=1 Tax=Pedobacter albus TaxID=3113905 RepID=A0ABU7IBI9_9SPHI|nr:hypothetical protein [Pedobacter sp. KR3-3]MEE1946714.1 hypothetical protein [Pedobacter sp. KR3-3]